MKTPNEPTISEPPKTRPNRLRRSLLAIGLVISMLVLLFCTLWAAAALYFDVRIAWLRVPLAIAYLLAVLAIAIVVKGAWKRIAWAAGGFVLVLTWWLTLQPSNNRDWQPGLAQLAYADIAGNTVTVHNIRNCDYRSESDFDVHYYDKTFDLDKIRAADLYMVYWGSPHMAHTMVSF